MHYVNYDLFHLFDLPFIKLLFIRGRRLRCSVSIFAVTCRLRSWPLGTIEIWSVMILDSSEFCLPELPKSSEIVFTSTTSLDMDEREGKDEGLCMFMLSTLSFDGQRLFMLVDGGFVFVVLSTICSLLSTDSPCLCKISSINRSSVPFSFLLLLLSLVWGSYVSNEVGVVRLFPRGECNKARTTKSKDTFHIVEVEIQHPL